MITLKVTHSNLISVFVALVLAKSTASESISDLSCDFDIPQNYCKWNPTSAQPSNWKWSQTNSRTVNFTGPLGTVDKKGYFIMSYNRNNGDSYEPTATLLSHVIDAFNKQTCLQFYYFIYGVGVDRLVLSVVNVSATQQETEIWSRRTPSGDFWHFARVNIPSHTFPFKLKFSVFAGGGAIALDKFTGLPNQCPYDSMCDFESGICDWKQFNNSSNTFKIIQALNDADQDIIYDHTTQTKYGHLLQTSGLLNNRAVIVKETPALSSTHCLIFWYYREKGKKSKLEVLLFGSSHKNISIWNSSLTYPSETWHRALVVVSPEKYGYFQTIGMSATQLGATPTYSPVNVDDITLRSDRCPQPITCDFNVDMCGFIHNFNNEPDTWVWDHGYGRVEYGSQLNFIYSPTDRTAPLNGMFLYTDFTTLRTFYSYRNMRIDSEYVSATTASCLTFYYLAMDSTSNSTFIINAWDNTGNRKTKLWSYSRAKDPNTNIKTKSWIKVKIEIQMSHEFKLSFEVTTNVSNTYIALDDISFRTGKCSQTSIPTTMTSLQTSMSVPHKQQVSCDFEAGNFCGWQQGTTEKWSINQLHEDLHSDLKPPSDHTIRNINGKYAYIQHSRGGPKTAILTVSDTYVTQNNWTGQSCFSLWYYMRAEGSAKLQVDSYKKLSTITVRESAVRYDDWGEKWNLLQFETDQDIHYNKFNITAFVKNAFVAIDDIKINHRPCSLFNAQTFQCNFEEQNSSCGFGSISVWTPRWKLVKGSALSKKLVDHTLRTLYGHMMAMDSDFNDTLASQWLAPTQGSCITFSYLMTGLKNNEVLGFKIIEENTMSLSDVPVLWSVSGDLGNNWYKHRVTISSDLQWRAAFSAHSKSLSTSGIIAIDDINIDFDEPCPLSGKCDFEFGDTCLWQNQKPSKGNSFSRGEKLRWANLRVGEVLKSTVMDQSDLNWIVYSPSETHSTQYPSFDHTFSKPDGYYLLLKADESRIEGHRTILMSDRYDIDPNHKKLCLSFYYYFKGKDSSAKTQLDIYQSEQFSSVLKIAKIKTPQKSINNWIPFNTTIRPITANSTNIWFYLVGTIIEVSDQPFAYASNLAIDDISITSGECASVDNMFDCSPTQRIPLNKVCNKVKECSNGIDEKVCGSCDFENNFLCGFGIQWNRENPLENSVYKWRFGDSSNGPKAGADYSTGYMIARRLGPINNEPYGQTDLITPIIKGAQAGCYVTFQYNIKKDPNFSAPNSTLTLILSSQNGFERTEIWNSDAIEQNNGQWISGSAFLKRMTYNFTLIFRARDSGITPDSYIAIDNILFNNCEVPQTQNSGDCDPSIYFECPKSGCISKYFLCDYTDDCGDNMDELSCSNFVHRTDFESGWSDWMPQTESGWILKTGTHSLTEGQTRDHTTGTGQGHFAYLSSDGSEQTKIVSLIGPYIPAMYGCTLTMWTDIEGNSSLVIKLLNVNTGRIGYQIARNPSNNRFAYERQIIDLYFDGISNSLYRIYIQGSVSPNKLLNGKQRVSYISIDDISLSPECKTNAMPTGSPPTPTPNPNPCPTQKPYDCKNSVDPNRRICLKMENVCDFLVDCPNNNDERDCGSCSFDKQDLCGWHNIGDGRQKWSLQNAAKFRDNPFIPNSDSSGNNTGSFIIIDTSKGGTFDTEAIISTPSLGATAANCKLTFFYHHSNPNQSPIKSPFLTIKINNPKTNQKKTIAEIRKEANSWSPYSVHIGAMASGFQVLIAAKGQISDETEPFADIEIDNIQLTKCEDNDVNWDTTINCTFESGTCGWNDVDLMTNSKLDWVREKSPTVDPGYDHTSKKRPLPDKYGTWLRTRKELTMNGNNTATFMTIESIESPNIHCLTFWYHMWGSNLAQFALILNQYKSEYGGNVLWMKRTPQSNNWLKESVTVQSKVPYYLMFSARLQPPNGRHEDTIGLDDITWTDGKCPNTPICDFEVDLCSWVSTDKAWVQTVPSHSKDKTIKPRVDHTLGLESGAFVRLNRTNQKLGSLLTHTFIDSTPLEDSTPFTKKQMCLKFWYFRSTTSPYNNTLDIQVSTKYSEKVQIYTVWTINQFPEWGIFNDQWMYGRVNLTLVNKDIIGFKGQLNDNQSAIAIDDINLESHPCEPMGWCDFESNMCGWTNAITDSDSQNILWLRNSGSSTSTLNGPKIDHTSKTLEGWYAFVPSDSQESGIAVLMSEPLIYQVLCLKFYYQITSDTNIVAPKLQVLFTSPNGITQVIANITSNSINQWIAFNVTHQFQTVVRYRLILKTIKENFTQSDVAVDDIQVWEDTCADVSNSRDASTQPSVLLTTVPEIEKQFDCNFESKGCKWSTKPSNVWIVSHWTEGVSKVGPRFDHTLRTPEGHYLLFDSSKESVKQSTASYSQIESGVMPFTENPNCLSFWYYSDSESFFNISVSYGIQSSTQSKPNPLVNTLLMTPTVTSSSWKQIKVQLPVVPKITIAISVLFHNKMIGSLAFDDITLNPGKCQLMGQICDFSYNYCGFQVNRVSFNKIGILANKAILQQYKFNGPEWDHTTKSAGNYFLFTNEAKDPNTFYTTQLIIPALTPTLDESRCLRFWYQITGPTSNLQIFVAPVHQYTYNYPNWKYDRVAHTHWTMARLTINAQYVHKIVFSLTKSKDMNYIALDDISISEGQCEPPVSCDFDIDWCDWYFLDGFNDTNWKWGRLSGPVTDVYWPGTWYDHTLNKQGGFLYLTAYRDSSTTKMLRNAYIESMPVSANQSNCFSFYAQIIGSDASLQVFVVQFSRLNQTTRTHSLQTIKTPTQKWTKFNVKLDSTLLSKDIEVAFRIKGSFSDNQSFIALDDISVSSDAQCDNTLKDAFECTDGTKIDSRRVCNFVNDCKQAEDENDCGNCDFENGMCGWTNTRKLNNQMWIRKSSDNRTFPTGPLVDGQSKPNGYYMIVQNYNIGYDKRAHLESSVDQVHRFKRSHTTCRMSFNYYMSGADATLRVIVKEGPSSFNYVWRIINSLNGKGVPKWQKAVADIGEHRSLFSVQFEANIESKTQVIAIDDINFAFCGPPKNTTVDCSDGQLKCPMDSVCIDESSLCDGIDDCGSLWDEAYIQCSELPKCTFESNTRCPEIFSIESENGLIVPWSLVDTSVFDNLGQKTGPTNDHTFRLKGRGIYLVLKGAVRNKNKKSKLVTFWMQSSGMKCAVRLFYYMYGSDAQMGSLRIYGRTGTQTLTNPSPILKRGNLGQQWFRAIYAINSSEPFQFVIEGQVGAGSEADIAIDDISFSSGCIRSQSKASTTVKSNTSLRQSSSTHNYLKTTSQKTLSTISSTDTSISKITDILTTVPSTTLFSISKKSSETTLNSKKPSLQSTTPSTILTNNKGRDDTNKKGIGPYELAASITAPVVVLIAIIVGFLFYKRYQRNKSEDTIPLNPTVINLTERNS